MNYFHFVYIYRKVGVARTFVRSFDWAKGSIALFFRPFCTSEHINALQKGRLKKGKGWGVASSRWHFPLNGNVSNFNTKWLAEGRLGQMQCLVCFSSIAIALTSDTWTHTQFHTHSEKDICIKYKKKTLALPSFGNSFHFHFTAQSALALQLQSFLLTLVSEIFLQAKINKMLFIENCYRLAQTRILILLPSFKFRGSLKAGDFLVFPSFFWVSQVKPLESTCAPNGGTGQHYDKMCI